MLDAEAFRPQDGREIVNSRDRFARRPLLVDDNVVEVANGLEFVTGDGQPGRDFLGRFRPSALSRTRKLENESGSKKMRTACGKRSLILSAPLTSGFMMTS